MFEDGIQIPENYDVLIPSKIPYTSFKFLEVALSAFGILIGILGGLRTGISILSRGHS